MQLAAADVVAVTGHTDMWLDADVIVVTAFGRTDMRLAADVVVVVGCNSSIFCHSFAVQRPNPTLSVLVARFPYFASIART